MLPKSLYYLLDVTSHGNLNSKLPFQSVFWGMLSEFVGQISSFRISSNNLSCSLKSSSSKSLVLKVLNALLVVTPFIWMGSDDSQNQIESKRQTLFCRSSHSMAKYLYLSIERSFEFIWRVSWELLCLIFVTILWISYVIMWMITLVKNHKVILELSPYVFS